MKKAAKSVALFLSIISAINCGFIGLFKINIISLFLGENSLTTRSFYILCGMAGVYLLITFFLSSKIFSAKKRKA
jgi:uncharacterized membrane protein YuzA (DUF378 family)